MQRFNSSTKYLKTLCNIREMSQKYSMLSSNFTIFVNIYHDLLHKERYKTIRAQDSRLRYFMGIHDNNITVDITNMTIEELNNLLQDLMTKNREKQLEKLIKECIYKRKYLSPNVLKKLFRHYSNTGRVELVEVLQDYCFKVDHNLYLKNGKFSHYIAKAQCMRGNSEQGLSVLKEAYISNKGLRSFYRVILKELIEDTVLNRSEATMVIFKKYVLEFSTTWNDHYPLVCYWHMCWSSDWFSDQVLSSDLLDTSEVLRDIVRDKASIFSITILREYNEDAVVRLLQSLLKYHMTAEYTTVLQILFNYKLKNKDVRGCAEIIRNCETLGVSLPADEQSRYIKMLIYKDYTYDKPDDKSRKPTVKNFKLKF